MPLIRLIALIAALLAAAAPAAALAQDWPNRPVTLVVPVAPAGAFDVMARVFTP
jgi:tripartite-type tricarboxylate transporter receptor subunit TctC